MPPAAKITKQKILDKAIEIVRLEGMNKLNVRYLASKLGCSTQPILYYFKSIDELKTEILNKAFDIYHGYMFSDTNSIHAFLNMGISYVKFAKNEPELFKLIFMDNCNMSLDEYLSYDKDTEKIIKAGMKMTGFDYEEQYAFQTKAWVFVHGLAVMVATKSVDFKDKEILDLVRTAIFEMATGIKWIKQSGKSIEELYQIQRGE